MFNERSLRPKPQRHHPATDDGRALLIAHLGRDMLPRQREPQVFSRLLGSCEQKTPASNASCHACTVWMPLNPGQVRVRHAYQQAIRRRSRRRHPPTRQRRRSPLEPQRLCSRHSSCSRGPECRSGLGRINSVSGKPQRIWLIDPVYADASEESSSMKLLSVTSCVLGGLLDHGPHFSHRFSRSLFYTGKVPTAYRWYRQHNRVMSLGGLVK
ncbi:hypothetical protein CULCFH20161_00920 [Corynebacterium ulcerans]|nr:hypothetical protein CULC0211_00920 [Corynebacterium ulcerans]BBJ73265.1 hypothetical protein CULCFH20161_00920 [Corynebacterium ulcerans]